MVLWRQPHTATKALMWFRNFHCGNWSYPRSYPARVRQAVGHSDAICVTENTFLEIGNNETAMSIYKVKRDYERGIWVKDHPNPVVEVRAANPEEAARLVLGRELRRKGRRDQYCAQVWPLGGVQRAGEIAPFYSV
jgi:hypothetical protein